MYRFGQRVIAAGAVVAACALAAACSSSGSSDSGSTASGSGGSSGSATTTGGTAYNLSAAVAAATKAQTRPTSIGITTKVQGTVPTGKKIDFVACGGGGCASDGVAAQEAAAAVHWNLKVINAGITASSITAAWKQVVTDKPNAVINVANPVALFKPELAQLKAAGIPVVNMGTADPVGNGIVAVFGGPEDYGASGVRMGNYLLAQNGGKAFSSLSVYSSAYPALVLQAQKLKATVEAACPSCNVESLDVPATSIGGDLPSRITSYLASHPDVKWVWDGYSDMVLGLPSALAGAGLSDVKVITTAQSTASLGYLAHGQAVVAIDDTSGFDSSWRAIDYLIRTFMHQSTAPDTATLVPAWLITKDGLPTTNPTALIPEVPNYQAQYKALWGVS